MSLLNQFNEPILKAEWLLTRACQLYCKYCEIAHKPINLVSKEQMLAIASRLKEWDIFPVIYGGECTLHPHFEDLLKHFKEIDHDYAIITHGLIDYNRVWKWINKYDLRNLSVSVDTLKPWEYPDDSDIALKSRSGYALLKFTEGLVRDRVNCCTITKTNIHEIPEIVYEMSHIGVYSILTLVNQSKPGFQYSSVGANELVPSQDQLEKLVSELKSMRALDPSLLFHEPEAVWDMWLQHGVRADWHCSKFSKFTIDADGYLSCCVDWKGKNFGRTFFLDVTEENFKTYETLFLDDIWDCKGCAWAPIKLLEEEMSKGEIGHDMIRHKLPNQELQELLKM